MKGNYIGKKILGIGSNRPKAHDNWLWLTILGVDV